jgi:magnesium and cobalt transporter
MSKVEQNPDPVSRNSKNKFLRFLTKIKKKISLKDKSSFEESVSQLVKAYGDSKAVHTEEKAILENMVTFGDLEVREVMIPRTDIIAVPSDIKLVALKKIFVEEGHSRVPVYNDSIDEIQGFIHVKDLFEIIVKGKKLNIKNIIRELIYAPRSMKIPDLLTKMKQSAIHIAIVLDEYGGTDGLVTIEDIVEKLVGEIKDEYDENEIVGIIECEDGYKIDAKVKLDVLEKYLPKIKIDLDEKEFDTIGGLILTLLGRIPKKGERIHHPNGYDMEVADSNSRMIKSVKIRKLVGHNLEVQKD